MAVVLGGGGSNDRVAEDPARDVVGCSDPQETLTRVEDLDLVAAIEPFSICLSVLPSGADPGHSRVTEVRFVQKPHVSGDHHARI
jgi:hypothetical protein